MNANREAARRRKIISAVRASTQLEGSSSTPPTRADQDAYADGLISAVVLVERTRDRYSDG
ncbi:hypothetical protein L2K20_22160 [Mycobacterium sp. MBM]|nr:hypothetical protein [Mycobacterium sp. MBM]